MTAGEEELERTLKELRHTPRAERAHQELLESIKKVGPVPCHNRGDEWDCYDEPPTPMEAYVMCMGCPLTGRNGPCYRYGVEASQDWARPAKGGITLTGVFGGVVIEREMAQKEGGK